MCPSHPLSDEECKFQRLVPIESRVAAGLVIVREVVLSHLLDVASDAFGDVLARHLQMHSPGVGSHLGVNVEEGAELVPNPVERTSLVAVGSFDGVSVNRVRHPKHSSALALHRSNKVRQPFSELLGAHAYDDNHPAGNVVGVNRVEDLQQLLRSGLVADLHSYRVVDA